MMLSRSAVMTVFFSSWPPCRIPLPDQLGGCTSNHRVT